LVVAIDSFLKLHYPRKRPHKYLILNC